MKQKNNPRLKPGIVHTNSSDIPDCPECVIDSAQEERCQAKNEPEYDPIEELHHGTRGKWIRRRNVSD